MIKRSEERNLIFKLHIKIVKDEKHDYFIRDFHDDDPGRKLSLVKLFPAPLTL